ncbi:MAG: DUF3526 domain-containing protein [Gammaproteobacteria bacterium]
MLITQCKHELRQLAADRLLYALIVLFAVLIAYGLWNGERWVRFQERAIAAAHQEEASAVTRAKQQAERIRLGQEKPRWWSSASDLRGFLWYHLVSYAVKPPAPLAALAVGQSDLYPYLLKVDPGAKAGFSTAYETANPRKLFLGPFDLAFVIIYLLPLFILALSYDLLAAEKESGVLSLLAAQPVSLLRIVLGKIGFRLSFILLLIGGLLGAALALTGFGSSAPELLWRLLGWFGVVAAYAIFWFFLAMLVIAYGGRSATNALALAALWLVAVVLVPAGVNLWITTAYPLPSRTDYVKTLRDTGDEIYEQETQITERFFADHPELKPQKAEEGEAGWVIGEMERDRRLQAVESAFTGQLQRQQDLAEQLKFLSPALLVHSAFLDLSGTGMARHRQFLAQVDTYHAELQGYFNPKLIKGEYAFSSYDAVPRFRYREEPARDQAQRLGADMLGLLIPALLTALLAGLALRRYPVVSGQSL